MQNWQNGNTKAISTILHYIISHMYAHVTYKKCELHSSSAVHVDSKSYFSVDTRNTFKVGFLIDERIKHVLIWIWQISNFYQWWILTSMIVIFYFDDPVFEDPIDQKSPRSSRNLSVPSLLQVPSVLFRINKTISVASTCIVFQQIQCNMINNIKTLKNNNASGFWWN